MKLGVAFASDGRISGIDIFEPLFLCDCLLKGGVDMMLLIPLLLPKEIFLGMRPHLNTDQSVDEGEYSRGGLILTLTLTLSSLTLTLCHNLSGVPCSHVLR